MIPKSLADVTVLNNGVRMPWFGLGVYKAKEGKEVQNSVLHALEYGYRSIDTAAFYNNEEGVGQALRDSGLAPEEIFVTTKVWNTDQGYENTLKAFENSRKKLRKETLDLYLIHWPVKGKYKDTWKALVKLYKEGYVRAIGVSNFKVHHLEDLLQDADVLPSVNQVEYHPHLTQEELLAYCKTNNIQLEAWSPLVRGQIFDNPVIQELSRKYERTPAQVILRWDLQMGVVTIPKSVHTARIEENAEVFDFELSTDDVSRISGLNQDKRVGPDPDHIDF